MTTDEMEIDRFIVNDIRVGEDRRAIDPKKVEALAESIEIIGLQTPITVWTAGDDGGGHSAVHLVAGLHRLEAYKKLGLKLIEAFRTSGGELDRDLWRIDENLMRSDLTELERADHTARRAKIIRARKQLFAKSAKKASPNRPNEGQADFDKDTAAATGRSVRGVQADKRRGEKIAPDVQDAIKDTPAADIGVELDAIADLDPKDQPRAVARVNSGASKNFREARVFILGDAAADKARRKAVKIRIRQSNAEREATLVRIPNAEEREAMAVKASTAETLDEMGTYYEKEREELRRAGFVVGHSPGQQRDHSELGNLKTAWRCAADPARAAFVEWAADALRLGMKNRAGGGGGP